MMNASEKMIISNRVRRLGYATYPSTVVLYSRVLLRRYCTNYY
jgi:hypothetical protein